VPGRLRGPSQASGEADALTAWRARGTVELVAADVARRALLLERLDASRSLAGVRVTEAAAVARALARTQAIEAPGSFPCLQAKARQLAITLRARQRQLHDPVPGQWVALAARLAADLADDPPRLLVHTDLHYGNILASQRPGQPWVAIDPAAAVGRPRTLGGGIAVDPGQTRCLSSGGPSKTPTSSTRYSPMTSCSSASRATSSASGNVSTSTANSAACPWRPPTWTYGTMARP
jgi:hypothetical protein